MELIARGVLLDGERVLLCQNKKHGYLYLPGGHIEFGEPAAGAVEREFLEETGLRVHAGRLLMIDEGTFATAKRTHHEINLVFHVEHTGSRTPKVQSQEEHIAFMWVDLAAAPELDIRPLSAKALLASGGQPDHAPGAIWVPMTSPRQ